MPTAGLLCEVANVHRASANSLMVLAKRAQVERLEFELDVRYEEALSDYRQENRKKD